MTSTKPHPVLLNLALAVGSDDTGQLKTSAGPLLDALLPRVLRSRDDVDPRVSVGLAVLVTRTTIGWARDFYGFGSRSALLLDRLTAPLEVVARWAAGEEVSEDELLTTAAAIAATATATAATAAAATTIAAATAATAAAATTIAAAAAAAATAATAAATAATAATAWVWWWLPSGSERAKLAELLRQALDEYETRTSTVPESVSTVGEQWTALLRHVPAGIFS